MKIKEIAKSFNINIQMPVKTGKAQAHFVVPAPTYKEFSFVLKKNGRKMTPVFIEFMEQIIMEDHKSRNQQEMF